MQDWKVPGLAIAVVKNDSIVLMKGYGTRTMGNAEAVDEHTLFAIGSASKAFTATLVAMLVDQGKMRWDDPATAYLPDVKINVATPHTDVNDTLLIVPWHNIDNIGPAGSINSNVSDMIKWVRFQLAQGSVSGKPLLSASALGETHTAQMVIPVGPDARQLNPYTHLNAYGMGWFLGDYRGRELDQHGGNIDGMSAMVAVMPEEKLGLVILTNANGSPVPTIVMNRVIDHLLNEPARDWNSEFRKQFDKLL